MNVNVAYRKMKGILIAVCCLLCLGARGQGIVFDEGTFDEALAKAKEEGKRVFVDCYTSWCGPCKRMAQQVFPTAEVGEAMNGRFVCLARDMEKGEGAELARRYRVASYPTFLILNADGSLCHKFVGATGPQTFLARVEEAMDPGKAMGPLEKRYEEGDREKEMLARYAEMLKECNDARLPEVIGELFTRLTDEERLSEEYRYIYGRVDYFPVGSEAWDFLVEHRADFERVMGEQQVTRLLYLNYWDILRKVFSGDRENLPLKELEEMERGFEGLGMEGETYTIIHAYFRLAKAMHAGDAERVIGVCEEEFGKLPRNRRPRGVIKLYEGQLTEAQEARWKALMDRLEQES